MSDAVSIPPLSQVTAPFVAWRGTVAPEWIDLNNHMTSISYPNLFHANCGKLFRMAGMHPARMVEQGLTIFQRESRVSYERELKLGDPIQIRSWLIDHDAKRLHHLHELWHEGQNYRAAFIEYVSFHIDVSARRTAPFRPEVHERLEIMAAECRAKGLPEGPGRPIGLGRRH